MQPENNPAEQLPPALSFPMVAFYEGTSTRRWPTWLPNALLNRLLLKSITSAVEGSRQKYGLYLAKYPVTGLTPAPLATSTEGINRGLYEQETPALEQFHLYELLSNSEYLKLAFTSDPRHEQVGAEVEKATAVKYQRFLTSFKRAQRNHIKQALKR